MLCLKQNYYAFCHLGYSYLSPVCVTSQPGNFVSVEGISGHFHNNSCDFTFHCSKLKKV